MACRSRWWALTLAEGDSDAGGGGGAVPNEADAGARRGASVGFIGHLLGKGRSEPTAEQVAEQLQEGLLLRLLQARPQLLGEHRERRPRRERGGTRRQGK